MLNLLKSTIQQTWRKWKSDPKCISGSRPPPKVNQFCQL